MGGECQHIHGSFWIEDVEHCILCGAAVTERCETCGGEGVVQEDEYEGDWINYGPNLIACPDCNGNGVVPLRGTGVVEQRGD